LAYGLPRFRQVLLLLLAALVGFPINISSPTALAGPQIASDMMDNMSMPGMKNTGDAKQSSTAAQKAANQSSSTIREQNMGSAADRSNTFDPNATDLKRPRWNARLEFNVVGEPTHNQDQPPLSLQDLKKFAQDNNPTLIQARAQIDGEKGKALQAGLFPNPAIAYNGDLMGLRAAGAGEWQGGLLQQDVILGGKLRFSRLKYLARADAARQQAQAQAYRVANDVTMHYFRTLAALERLRMQNEFLKSTRDRWITVREMLNLGQANQADKHFANVALEEQNLKVLEAENDLSLAWENLTSAVGTDLPYRKLGGTLESTPQDLEWQTLLDRLMKDSPQLKEAREKLRSDEITVRRERRQKIPNLALQGGGGYDQLDGGFAARANLGVTNIPLFDRNQGTVQQALADLSRQRAQIKLIELQLRCALAKEYAKYTTASQHVEAYKKVIIPESQSRYSLLLKSYADTRVDWPEVLEAQRDYLRQRLCYIDHLLALRESETVLNGFLLTGALEAPPGVTPPGHIDATPKPR
jgi:outer membrane protein TolC